MTMRWCATVGLMLGSILTGLLGCGHSPTEGTGGIVIVYQTVLKASLPGNSLELPDQETVRDRASWQRVWMELHAGSPAPLPEVDFSREMVVLVVGPGCNGRVDITAIDREGGELVVRAETQNCSNAVCAIADFAVHVVRVTRFDGPVRFMVRREVGLC